MYSVGTFVVLAAAYTAVTSATLGWQFGPTDDRVQTTVTLLWYLVAGLFAMKVGRHGDVSYGEALRSGLRDVGRTLKGMVMR